MCSIFLRFSSAFVMSLERQVQAHVFVPRCQDTGPRTACCEVYAKKMERQRDTRARMDALIRAADWHKQAQTGRSSGRLLPKRETK